MTTYRMFFLKYLKFLFLFCFAFSFGQNPAVEIVENYADHFNLKKEAVYLHLNKTTFLPQENLWFTAYTYYSDIQEPCRSTSTLSVALYDEEGKLIEDKVIYLDNGAGSGFFGLNPNKFPPGTYFIRALTPYLRNFQEDYSFLQKIKIAGGKEKTEGNLEYDLQLLPESGHLLQNSENTVAVKLIDNSGRGVSFKKGTLINNGKPIKLFESNRFGMGKFQIFPMPGENYKIEVTTHHGKQLQMKVPDPESVGIILSVGRTHFGQYRFSIKTNPETLPRLRNKDFVLAIHQDGKMRAFNFRFSDSTQVDIDLSSNVLYTGTNIATVFDEAQRPVAERLLFNRTGILRREISAAFQGQDLDSLVLELKSDEELLNHHLSLSILPAGTESYRPEHNIFSAFYLKPFLNGHIEDAGYYFSSGGNIRRKNMDLDLLLLSQGWSQYSWDQIFKRPVKEVFPHQIGFSVKGHVLDRIKDDHKLIISSPLANLWENVKVSKKGKFELDHAFVIDSSAISFTLVREKNNKAEHPPITFKVLPKFQADSIYPVPVVQAPVKESKTIVQIPENFLRESEVLDTVYLEGKYIPKEGETVYLKENSRSTKTVISEREEQAFYSITDYLRFQGFKVRERGPTVFIYSTRADLQIKRKPKELMPELIIDGVRAPTIMGQGLEYPDYSRLVGMTTKEVKSIIINKSGAGMGFGGQAGFIEIETRKTPRSYDNGSPSSSTAYITENGYNLNKKFYTPKYSSYTNPYFQKIGTYGWFPNLTIENGKEIVKILNTLQQEVRLYFEGITQGGYLISEEILVETGNGDLK